MLGKTVNARVTHILVEAHKRAVRHGLIHQAVLMQSVSREYYSAIVAPIVYGLHEAFKKKSIGKINIMKLDGRYALAVLTVESSELLYFSSQYLQR